MRYHTNKNKKWDFLITHGKILEFLDGIEIVKQNKRDWYKMLNDDELITILRMEQTEERERKIDNMCQKERNRMLDLHFGIGKNI